MRKRQSGLGLIELLVSMVIVAAIAAAATRALITGFNFERNADARRAEYEPQITFERNLKELIRSAFMSANPDDATTYFFGVVSEGSTSAGADTLIFTARGERLPADLLVSTDDFETNHSRFGPVGGTVERMISMTPVGSVGELQGLFLREQRPADGDPTQGGYEQLLEPSLTYISYEFFDGLNWVPEWNTDDTNRRLPAAILVRYTLADGEEQSFVVKVPLSDVSPAEPVEIGEAPPE